MLPLVASNKLIDGQGGHFLHGVAPINADWFRSLLPGVYMFISHMVCYTLNLDMVSVFLTSSSTKINHSELSI